MCFLIVGPFVFSFSMKNLGKRFPLKNSSTMPGNVELFLNAGNMVLSSYNFFVRLLKLIFEYQNRKVIDPYSNVIPGRKMIEIMDFI